ncbi:CDP-diacylglycerol--serine O-phosphatidyltransferase [Candidatus Palibaumannia cicadellinicola]|uniref:CDP-diacylglycerol--serine O-phosphatidyltransferase n=1 Tax=Candidatus Palibaumannia cicadellinicola TaxID=186490 RepID=A0A0K2BKC5_9GAMM|nr:CDP-diacylglycerol--serine O-phosphatidyltransferase [Candidatus Baumannia cicadellinicola]AKZ65652.1 CDP-diacylglycerol--serine O-phosphatidyltransferase [Candidatus Baumannia cicadellinicola]
MFLENSNKHQQYLIQLPKISQNVADIQTLYSPKDFYHTLLKAILGAKHRIYIVSLYLEKDQGGEVILNALYQARKVNPNIDIVVLVDLHRAQRSRIGGSNTINTTNADWYYQIAESYPDVNVPVYGVPINTREALGILHLKGFIVDNNVIYSGASINNVYLHKQNKYRYDRYYMINNQLLADSLLIYIKQQFLTKSAVNKLNDITCNKSSNCHIKNYNIRLFRHSLRYADYCYEGSTAQDELTITPLVGLGTKSILNQTIHHLICSINTNITLCTPYFNMPAKLSRDLVSQLRKGKQIEVIVGDKTANDFYINSDNHFKIIGILPYLYEINLRSFIKGLQNYLDNGQLIIRLWKHGENSYHIKGLWADKEWLLLTGNNFNQRSWRLDLENALLIHDPNNELYYQREQELTLIRTYTKMLNHYTELQSIADYPVNVRKIIRRLRPILIHRLINQII